MRSYCINGWNEDIDPRTGNCKYTCPECGTQEGWGHEEYCSRSITNRPDDKTMLTNKKKAAKCLHNN